MIHGSFKYCIYELCFYESYIYIYIYIYKYIYIYNMIQRNNIERNVNVWRQHLKLLNCEQKNDWYWIEVSVFDRNIETIRLRKKIVLRFV